MRMNPSFRAIVALFCAALIPSTAIGQTSAVSVEQDPLSRRAEQLPALLSGKVDPTTYFTPEFLAAVPRVQLQSITDAIAAQHGAAQQLLATERSAPTRAVITVQFERSVGKFQMAVDPSQQGRVSGLLVTGFEARNDSVAKILDELRALPGQHSLFAVRLDGETPVILAEHQPDQVLAIGSTFKLYLLAELDAQIKRRKLGWDHVTAFDRPAFSSQATENWPIGSPATLHTLASWMISVSDNGATDVLLEVLGRDAVGRRLQSIGNSAVDRNLPFFGAVEAFALKAPANDDLRDRFLRASEADQRRMIDREADRLTMASISSDAFAGKAMHIDTIEWFASPRDLTRLLDHFRTSAGTEARAIMAMNPGISADTARKWQYLGYKGGSEVGVISMSFLLQSKAGHWYGVTGSWNNVAAPVDNVLFATLMTRMIDQVAKIDK